MRNKQYVAAIRAEGGKLMLSTMVFADEVVDPASIDELEAIEGIELNKKELAMAESLVASLSAEFEPDKFRDNYREQVLDLIERKAAGESFEAPTEERAAPQVVDLMAALEASVKAAKDARRRHPSGPAEKPVKAASKSTAKQATSEPDAVVKPLKTRAKKSA